MLFQSPRCIDAETFTTLPESLRTGGPHSPWNQARPGHAFTSFLEGPSFDLDGNLWCVDVVNGRIYKIAPDGTIAVAVEYKGCPNGLKIHPDGRIFVTDSMNGIMCIDPVSKRIEPFLADANGESFKGVNDLFYARNGDLYFTDQGATGLHDPTGRVFRYSPDGTLSCLLDNIPSPNGLVMNLKEDALYLAVTRGNAIWRIGISEDGTASRVGIFIQLSAGVGPDGLALDAEGRLYVAHAGLGTVWGFEQTGEPFLRIRTPQGLQSTNLAFGGTDNRTLMITEAASGTVCQVNLPVRGKPMYSHTRYPT
ncbi:TPA: SMP-30/gluconolactonase/LRE family protein [Burkholderia multivorans]|uniref:SMP-30/gluconolactonase/LRE family protein n=1 Tax=Burkholderia multivorans TaxID=87883 RepID=UPI002019EE88|nr:SMP-30/gluconolactonase/LRE family protein [Burkholderia multivorans]MCO1459911.1 SMP-30/gluconolactonase/LRE family protein [Burkholderia multivorans]UQO21322.1 SMP-30/gluconolactonase/LRE family protein [Burkholderia multivorans]HEM7842893.1 SMP-30/gluconolactonase/LRE family protein [Burkholderia multivorans]HEM7908278.1 SMP-30/gluconolactonase/LRE family protein [Burkholderia multivorans]HEM8539403.1 SMP-30/gluconolactonase/LRE family protein [Burkholderia multivorans]